MDVRAGLALPGLPPEHRLRALVRRRTAETPARPPGHAHWSATHWGLDRVPAYRQASSAQQAAALDACGRAALSEAWFIEKAGLAFGAKMLLLAGSKDERQLYALFAADEARHLDLVGGFLDEEPACEGAPDPFLALLAEAIERGDRRGLQVVVQVVLEGWGLVHYAGLARACASPALRAALEAIVADEAAHHGSGVVLAGEPGPLDEAFLEDVLARFLALVAPGPLGVAAALERALGGFSPAERAGVLRDLGAEAHARERLEVLRRLLAKAPAARAVAARLDERGAFQPSPPRRPA